MSWDDLTVASCGTHHLREAVPIYTNRFDSVLKFHAPGLAPVRLGELAWHIQIDGSTAYNSRFRRTFGFYEGLAAVVADDGAFHITPAGVHAYSQRYAWCGNFQGGRCTVRTFSGDYFHIISTGVPAYSDRWRYAGDYRDGIAVVQSVSGVSTHIDETGEMLHGIWFEDLDVFHKGFARARDSSGWMHIDYAGHPIYTRRFASVEPFYNGQARVETFSGGLEIIEESGRTLAVLRAHSHSEFSALSADMVGFWRTQTISSAVELGVLDALPSSTSELAQGLVLHADRLARLLRALSEMKIVQEDSGLWHLTNRGKYLRKDHPLTLAHAAIEYGYHFSKMWADLSDAVRRDGSWTRPDIFGMIAMDATRGELHHQMLRSYARHDYPRVPAALGLNGTEHLIDAGGGLGDLADALLEEYPNLNITVLDRPEVIEQARREHPKFARICWFPRDIFDDWGISTDIVVLARILHDWDDVDALCILTRARESLGVGGRLFVVEMVLSDENSDGGLCDLHLLMATGGKERTLGQFADLLKHAGFELREVRRLNTLPTILVAVAL